MQKSIYLLTISFFFSQGSVHAYLDPGSGSLLIYFVVGLITSLIYYFKDIYYRLKSFFASGKIKADSNILANKDILFHSEGKQYFQVFSPLLEECEKRKIKASYFTQGEDDPALELIESFKYIDIKYIGNDLASYNILNNIRAKLFVTTTPQLDVMQLKRSPHVKNYIHIFHAPTDIFKYKPFAFDFFDTVMCSGKHQIDSIRLQEETRQTKPKTLLETGLTYYDFLVKKKAQSQDSKDNAKTTVLVAPTWNTHSLLYKFGTKPIEILLDAGFRVILRPHPQMYISQKELILDIENKLKSFNDLSIDRAASAADSYAKSDIMLSDISGAIFDFYFVYEKPVIVINSPFDKTGFDGEFLDKKVWEVEAFLEFATLINENDIANLKAIVNHSLDKHSNKKLTEFRANSIFNYGNANKTAINQLESLLLVAQS